MELKFYRRIFWTVGITLVVLGTLSFYVRYQTLKYDLRQSDFYEEINIE